MPDVPTSELSNLNIKPESTFHTQNHPVYQSPIYNSDNDFDYQNQEFLSNSQCDTYCYNDTFFNRNRNQVTKIKNSITHSQILMTDTHKLTIK